MSVAKTPAQQEASLANIRIIKARFAKDGQSFEDCIFDNDKMQIIIDDPRYRYTKTYKGLKHYGDDDINKFEEHANNVKEKSSDIKIHEAISMHENDIMRNPQALNELIRRNNEPEMFGAVNNIEMNKNFDTEIREANDSNFKNIDENNQNILEIDESEDIVVANDTIGEIAVDANVSLLDLDDNITQNVIKPTHKIPLHEMINKKITSEDIENLLLVDPDEEHGENKIIKDNLEKLRMHQNVMKDK